jgi:hypothetical protein
MVRFLPLAVNLGMKAQCIQNEVVTILQQPVGGKTGKHTPMGWLG